MQYKLLSDTKAPEILLMKILKDIDLDDDYDTLTTAEGYYSTARRKQLEQQARSKKK
jgi:hypothetical protein